MKTIAEQWLEASEWDEKQLNVPTIITRTIAKQLRKILSKATPFKQGIKFPKGEKIKSLSQLKKELDEVFSIFIRRRDSNVSSNYSQCVTCGVVRDWRELQAGHYRVRQDLATRWDERNVHSQCGACNGFRGGEPEKMAAYIDGIYGDGTAANLREQAKSSFKPNRQWYEMKIKHYREIIK